MTTVTCGRTNLSERAEEITRVLREAQGFCLDVGCGRAFDLDNELQHMRVYRCLECARWLCKPCIDQHFLESAHDTTTTARPRSQTVTEGAGESTRGGDPRTTAERAATVPPAGDRTGRANTEQGNRSSTQPAARSVTTANDTRGSDL